MSPHGRTKFEQMVRDVEGRGIPQIVGVRFERQSQHADLFAKRIGCFNFMMNFKFCHNSVSLF